jgi:hypothetical protein
MSVTGTEKRIGSRRTTNWWEPFYEAAAKPYETSDWNFSQTTGVRCALLTSTCFDKQKIQGDSCKFKNKNFENCDFQGNFEHKPTILFDDCKFTGCDFAYSNWTYANFRNCKFSKCSFSLARFIDCEFRDCSWDSIGISGNKTDLIRSFITNPDRLIKSCFSGTNPLRNDNAHRFYQKYRLEGTKAHFSRSMLNSNQSAGDDIAFYKTAKVNDVQQTKARIFESIYYLLYEKEDKLSNLIKFFYWTLEIITLYCIGWINGWGSSLFRPFFLNLISFYVFYWVYRLLPNLGSISHPIGKSFDISVLAGFSNQSQLNQTSLLSSIQNIQLIISIMFYTIFLSTAVSRFSRSR